MRGEPKSRPALKALHIRRALLSWFRREKRSLPWRGTSDPYRIWVSEIMLQQTTVGAVRGRYERFLRRFPNLGSLARSSEDAVLAAWSGLGYYGRARNLRLAARAIVRDHAGRVPRDPKTLEALPGFWPYTAAAVASLAYGVRVPAAEANVTRVLSRLFAIGGAAASRAHRDKVLARARALLPSRRPGDAIAALMDLGQTICTPRRPDCPRCLLHTHCAAFLRRQPERYPARPHKPRPVAIHFAVAFAASAGRALLVRRRSSFLDGLWEFPSAEAETLERAREKLSASLRPLGLRLATRQPAGSARHTVVNRRIQIAVFPAVPNSQFTIHNSQFPFRWFRPSDLERAAIPTLTRKIAWSVSFLRSPAER